MSEKQHRVIAAGGLLRGHDPNTARQALEQLFPRATAEQLDRFFGQALFTVSTVPSRDVAEKLASSLTSAGFAVDVESVDQTRSDISSARETVTSSKTTSGTRPSSKSASAEGPDKSEAGWLTKTARITILVVAWNLVMVALVYAAKGNGLLAIVSIASLVVIVPATSRLLKLRHQAAVVGGIFAVLVISNVYTSYSEYREEAAAERERESRIAELAFQREQAEAARRGEFVLNKERLRAKAEQFLALGNPAAALHIVDSWADVSESEFNEIKAQSLYALDSMISRGDVSVLNGYSRKSLPSAHYQFDELDRLSKIVEAQQQAELEQRAREAEQAKLERCLSEMDCLWRKHQIDAEVSCKLAIERKVRARTRYQFRWTDTGYGKPMFTFKRIVKTGVVGLSGRQLQVQNGFGAWETIGYRCEYDATNDATVSITFL